MFNMPNFTVNEALTSPAIDYGSAPKPEGFSIAGALAGLNKLAADQDKMKALMILGDAISKYGYSKQYGGNMMMKSLKQGMAAMPLAQQPQQQPVAQPTQQGQAQPTKMYQVPQQQSVSQALLNPSSAPIESQPGNTLPQTQGLGNSIGAFPGSTLSPLDMMLIGATTHSSKAPGYTTALNTIMQSSAAGQKQMELGNTAEENIIKRLNYELSLANAPFERASKAATAGKARQETIDLQNKQASTGAYDPTKIAENEGAKASAIEMAKLKAQEKAKQEAIKSRPEYALEIPSSVRQVLNIPYRTYADAALAGLSVEKIHDMYIRNKNAIVTSEGQNKAAETAQNNQLRALYSSMLYNRMQRLLTLERKNMLGQDNETIAAHKENILQAKQEVKDAETMLDSVGGKIDTSGRLPSRVQKVRGKNEPQIEGLPKGATDVRVLGDTVEYKLGGKTYEAKIQKK